MPQQQDEGDATGNVMGVSKTEMNASDRLSGKKRASGDELERKSHTILDDMVVVSPSQEKRAKLLDAELPDVDDDEVFPEDLVPPQRSEEEREEDDDDEVDAEMAELVPPADEEEGIAVYESQQGQGEVDASTDGGHQEDTDGDALEIIDVGQGEEEEGEDEVTEDEQKVIDINSVDEDEDDDEEEEEEEASVRGEQHAWQRSLTSQERANCETASELLAQLDDSTKTKLCLLVISKCGEAVFQGHEALRDELLLSAGRGESILSLLREAVEMARYPIEGSSAAPLEIDEEDEDDEKEVEEEEGEEDTDSVAQVRSGSEVEDSSISADDSDEKGGNMPQDEENEVDDGDEGAYGDSEEDPSASIAAHM